MMKGRIIKAIGGFYYALTEHGIYECRARGRFRKDGITPLVGDIALVQINEGGLCTLTEIDQRKNALVRPPVSNLDVVCVVVSSAPPETDIFLIDKMIAVCEFLSIEVYIVVNKIDIDKGDKLIEIYTRSGFPVFPVSAVAGQGVAALKNAIRGKLVAFCGNSGVGKSSILNLILPEKSLKVGDINEKIGRGRHTTRHSEIFPLEDHTFVIDTPGFSAFDTEFMNIDDKTCIEKLFREFNPFIDKCRFIGCSHVKEDGCKVLESVENGEICTSRHNSYVKIYESVKEVKPWEKKKQER